MPKRLQTWGGAGKSETSTLIVIGGGQRANLPFTISRRRRSPTVDKFWLLGALSIFSFYDQEAYFWYVMECFWHLQHEYLRLSGGGGSHPFPLPKKVARPPKYNATP